jgi:hypothetical protein
MSRTFKQLGTQIGELVAHKNASYGSSFAKSGVFLRLLFPEGVPPERMEDALLLVRIFDKQMRIATAKDAFGESPYQDIAGYGLLGTQLHEERMKHECASASSKGVEEPSTARNSSAAADATPSTTTPVSAPSEKPFSEPSMTPSSSSSAGTDASAPSATEHASAVEAALTVLQPHREPMADLSDMDYHVALIRKGYLL